MKNILSRFVEVVEDNENKNNNEVVQEQTTQEVKKQEFGRVRPLIVPENLNLGDILTIEMIYDKGCLPSLDQSIFKVKIIENALPNTLTKIEKKNTVLSLIPTTGLTKDQLLEDGQKRLDILAGTSSAFSSETLEKVADYDTQIAELDKQMESLKERKNKRLKEQEMQDEIILKEVEKIQEIISFIE